VDFDLARLMELFEQRFGRTVATVLLALVAFGISALMIGLIWSNLVDPVGSTLVDQWGEQEMNAALVKMVLVFLMGLALYWAGWRLFFRKRMTRMLDEAGEIQSRIQELQERLDLTLVEAQERSDESQRILNEAKQHVGQWRAVIEAAERDGASIPESLLQALYEQTAVSPTEAN
jgi:hypothetical protein